MLFGITLSYLTNNVAGNTDEPSLLVSLIFSTFQLYPPPSLPSLPNLASSNSGNSTKF